MKKLLILVTMLLSCRLIYAGLITHTDYTAGSVVTSAGQNSNENRVYNEFNGNIDNTNIKTGGIADSNLAASSITGDKIDTTNFSIAESTSNILHVSTITANGTQGYMLFYSSTICNPTQDTTTGTSYTVTVTGINITPHSTRSQIEIDVTGILGGSNIQLGSAYATLFRGGTTNLATKLGGNASADSMCSVDATAVSGITQLRLPCTMHLIDTPLITSSTNYAVGIKSDGTRTATWGGNNQNTHCITVKEWGY